eukprot:c7553_g1_i2.p1 GENE.c7553_g1_i2~~c7553_g1_i2.p1  ORF type:complete len:105 (-),score=37.87 c7553_g1_i2:71-385(-)
MVVVDGLAVKALAVVNQQANEQRSCQQHIAVVSKAAAAVNQLTQQIQNTFSALKSLDSALTAHLNTSSPHSPSQHQITNDDETHTNDTANPNANPNANAIQNID